MKTCISLHVCVWNLCSRRKQGIFCEEEYLHKDGAFFILQVYVYGRRITGKCRVQYKSTVLSTIIIGNRLVADFGRIRSAAVSFFVGISD